jgi:YD repeat-containing protein
MVTNSVRVFFILGCFLFGWTLSAAGQACTTTATCADYGSGSGCAPTLPLTGFAGTGDGPFEWQVTVKTPACASAPTSCLNSPAQPEAEGGRPIELATGNTYFTETDVRIPGLGGGLTLRRTWNSVFFTGISSVFGGRWTSNFEERVFVGADGYLKYSRGDGCMWSFGFTGWDNNGNPTYVPAQPATQVATITQFNQTQANQTWGLVLQNGEQRTFDLNSGRLLSISDRNGNTTSLLYDASFRLITVVDPAGRHLYFGYSGTAPYLVSNVTTDVGVSLSYSYDGSGRLAQVTEPDNSTLSFQYNAADPLLITAVLDSNGKVLESHAYNSCGQGLTSSRALGVDAITVSYPLSCHLGFLVAP